MANVKVLFSGAAMGKVEGMMKKAEAANKKVGADALFCVGQFFGPGSPDADPDDWLVSVVTGDIALPVNTYFIGGYGAGCEAILEALPASDAKLKYLGKAGVTQVAGLTVAYLDGSYNAAVYHSEDPSGGLTSQHSPYYTRKDVMALKDTLMKLEGEVDILLTCEWPSSITLGLPPGQVPEGVDQVTSQHASVVIDEIAELARPRYHFVGGQDCHFARIPYTNRDLGAGPRATRFISLADVDGAGKGKSLHALALVPSSDMDPDALAAIPDGSGISPYDSQRGTKRSAEDQMLPEGQDWRWCMKRPQRPGRGGGREGGKDKGKPAPKGTVILGRTDIVRDPFCMITARNIPFEANEADIITFFSKAGKVVDVQRGALENGKIQGFISVQFDTKESAENALALSGTDMMGRVITVEAAIAKGGRKAINPLGQAVHGCWFCLGSESVNLKLIASVSDETYLAVDKGAITDHHVLIVAIDHFPSTASMPPSTYAEVDRYLSALRSFYASMGKELVAFERYLSLKKTGGNHCHINAIAVSPTAGKQAGQAFQKAAQAAGFRLTLLPQSDIHANSTLSQAALKAAVGDCEYFMAVLPDGSRMIRPIMRDEKWPMNLGRDVLAQLAGVPERAEWKHCAVTPAEEEARTERFKEQFKSYDFAL